MVRQELVINPGRQSTLKSKNHLRERKLAEAPAMMSRADTSRLLEWVIGADEIRTQRLNT